jgi:hypothetical protein
MSRDTSNAPPAGAEYAMGGTSEPKDGNGANPKPTKQPLQTRSASPTRYNTSGMESALGALADKTHPPKLRKR